MTLRQHTEHSTKYHLNITGFSQVANPYIMLAVFFTALHGMQTRSSDENSVCPSVCLSVKCVHCDKMEERSIQIFIPDKRSFSLVFQEQQWLAGATPST